MSISINQLQVSTFTRVIYTIKSSISTREKYSVGQSDLVVVWQFFLPSMSWPGFESQVGQVFSFHFLGIFCTTFLFVCLFYDLH